MASLFLLRLSEDSVIPVAKKPRSAKKLSALQLTIAEFRILLTKARAGHIVKAEA